MGMSGHQRLHLSSAAEGLLASLEGHDLEEIASLTGQYTRFIDGGRSVESGNIRLRCSEIGDLYLGLHAESVGPRTEALMLTVGRSSDVKKWPQGPPIGWQSLTSALNIDLPTRIVAVEALSLMDQLEAAVDDGIILSCQPSRAIVICASRFPGELELSFDLTRLEELTASRSRRRVTRSP